MLSTPNTDAPFLPPRPPGPWRRFREAFGQEAFGRSVGPWGTLLTPLPLGALMLFLAWRLGWPLDANLRWLGTRLAECAALLGLPFLLAACGQALARRASAHRWRETEGEHHIDYSPRGWHYGLAVAVVLLPLALLQVSPGFLDFCLSTQLKWQSTFGRVGLGHAGYDPDVANLLIVGVLPLVVWQVKRILRAIPAGRLLGLQRELAQLRRAVNWEDSVWEEIIADTTDRWLADGRPAEVPATPDDLAPPSASTKQRQAVRRYLAFRREIVASYAQTPPDLLRANRALATYRRGQ